MRQDLYFPSDEFDDREPPDLDLAADYLELKAVFSRDGQSFSEDIVSALELAAEDNYPDVTAEIEFREAIATGAMDRMASRKRVLSTSYPFQFDDQGNLISFAVKEMDLGQTAYLVSLILSNLRALTPILGDSATHPSDQEVRELRQYFQYFATAAVAGEIGGSAWSFGFPRPDGTGFMEKLAEIWTVLKDGTVKADPTAPAAPKDDQVDVFAWREQKDGLPGFLLVAAQVATGKDWKAKSIKSHVARVFATRWFERPPVTEMVAYHVIPFARPDEKFRDDVLVVGNVLHRLRVPRRVTETASLARKGVKIEALDELQAATEWVKFYVEKARAA